MNPEITPELLAAAPVGSTVRDERGTPIAVRRYPENVGWWDLRRVEDDEQVASAVLFEDLPEGARLVWPADARRPVPCGHATEGWRCELDGGHSGPHSITRDPADDLPEATTEADPPRIPHIDAANVRYWLGMPDDVREQQRRTLTIAAAWGIRSSLQVAVVDARTHLDMLQAEHDRLEQLRDGILAEPEAGA